MEKPADHILKKGDLVQVNPEANKDWGGCFVQVTEVKPWGIQGGMSIPAAKGIAYIRLNWADIEFVGKAEWAIA